MIRKILATLDGSGASEQALPDLGAARGRTRRRGDSEASRERSAPMIFPHPSLRFSALFLNDCPVPIR